MRRSWASSIVLGACLLAFLLRSICTNVSVIVLGALMAVEAACARYMHLKARQLCGQARKIILDDKHDGRALMLKCLSRLRFSEGYLHTWFRGAALHQLRIGNIREFLAYGFWYKQYCTCSEDLGVEDQQFIESALVQLEQQTGITLPPGYNPDVRFMSHLWDPLRYSHKPLLFYIATECIALVNYVILRALGFKRHSFNGAVFYTLHLDQLNCGSSSSTTSSEEPLLFIHGVGAGVLPYLGLVLKLRSTGRPLVMPEYQHIAMRLTSHIPTVQQCAESAAAFLSTLGIRSVHVMGHSYGTLVCARFVTCYNTRVASFALFDPVCFSMYMPTLVHNFLYAECPNNGSWLLVQAMLMASRELHCAATFCRNFLWSDYNLWPDSLPPKTLVSISGGDVLCAAQDVKHLLEIDSSAQVLFHPTMHHGQLMLRPGYMDMLLKNWQQMLEDPAPAATSVPATAAAAVASTGVKLAAVTPSTAAAAASVTTTVMAVTTATSVAAAAASAAAAAAVIVTNDTNSLVDAEIELLDQPSFHTNCFQHCKINSSSSSSSSGGSGGFDTSKFRHKFDQACKQLQHSSTHENHSSGNNSTAQRARCPWSDGQLHSSLARLGSTPPACTAIGRCDTDPMSDDNIFERHAIGAGLGVQDGWLVDRNGGVGAAAGSVNLAQVDTDGSMSYKHKGWVRIDVDARGC